MGWKWLKYEIYDQTYPNLPKYEPSTPIRSHEHTIRWNSSEVTEPSAGYVSGSSAWALSFSARPRSRSWEEIFTDKWGQRCLANLEDTQKQQLHQTVNYHQSSSMIIIYHKQHIIKHHQSVNGRIPWYTLTFPTMSASLALQGQLPMAPCHLLCQLLGQCLCDLHAMAWAGTFEENDGRTSQVTCFS